MLRVIRFLYSFISRLHSRRSRQPLVSLCLATMGSRVQRARPKTSTGVIDFEDKTKKTNPVTPVCPFLPYLLSAITRGDLTGPPYLIK